MAPPNTWYGGLGQTTLAQMIFNDQRAFPSQIWICVSEDFNEKRLIEEIEEFIEEIEVKSDNTYFKMHDLIHDLATSLFLVSASSNNIHEINVGDYSHSMSVGFIELVPSYSSPSLLKKFVSLRALHLSNSELEQLPYSIGDLRYKYLAGNTVMKASKFADSCSVVYCHSPCCLPKRTTKLGSLRNLLIHGCDELTSMPPRIGFLTCLKTLSRFSVGIRKKGYKLGELQDLKLYGSIPITHLERVKNHTDAKEANLFAKGNLHSLSMIWNEPDR
ncbi:hypothetical protein H5410_005501 [Solanum commersonii]|uniref:Uncharacterized protein n=1 Tax=Solanum commersonii TaxID=4109 RepID=A0A9J6A7L5_SOLCO|nr:hypothetical protein H5410_005501 [Solanum commersonii]